MGPLAEEKTHWRMRGLVLARDRLPWSSEAEVHSLLDVFLALSSRRGSWLGAWLLLDMVHVLR